ncbi:MAG: hypothetical protein SOR94_04570, partial [Lawsonella sp.]|nr:hypothetical protein [Lawsonella sp.]
MIIMRFLSRCVAAACATLLTLASTTTACSAEPIPERPAYVPSWLWAALYDGKAYPSLDWNNFVVVNGKNVYIGFHYTTGYTFDCDMGAPWEEAGDRGMGCLGYMPTMGALPLTRSTYPIPSNNHRIFTRVVMSNDSLPVRAEAPAYAVDDGFYDNTPPTSPPATASTSPKPTPKNSKNSTATTNNTTAPSSVSPKTPTDSAASAPTTTA